MPFLPLWSKKKKEKRKEQSQDRIHPVLCLIFQRFLSILSSPCMPKNIGLHPSPLPEHALNFPTSKPLLTEPQVGHQRTIPTDFIRGLLPHL